MSLDEHNWFDDHAAAFVMGGLTADERERIESHARDCTMCAARLAGLAQTDQTMNHLFASLRPSAGFEQAIIDRLNRPMRLAAAKVNPFVRRAAVAAAAAIVLGGFGYVASDKINNGRWPAFSFEANPVQVSANMRQIGQAVLERSSDAQKWDYGGGSNTAKKWTSWNTGAAQQTATESSAHQMSAGQNVLSGDGHADHAGSFGNSSGGNGPGDANDSVLVPAEDKGFLNFRDSIHAPVALESFKGVDTYSGETTFSGGVTLGDALSLKARPAQTFHYFQPHTALSLTASAAGEKEAGIPLDVPPGGRSAGSLRTKDAPESGQLALADDQSTTSSPTEVPAHQPAAPEPAPGAGQAPPPAQPIAPQPIAPQPAQRKVIRNGTMEFIVDSFDSALLQVTAIVAEEGGYIDTTDSSKMSNGKVQGTITVRVPPDHLDVLVLKLRALGELKGQKINAEDVTQQYTDLASELRAARAMEERLLDLIKNGKGSIKDLLAAEKELGDWRGKIEKITGQMNYFDSLVAMSTLQLELTEKDIRTPALASETQTVDMGVEAEDVEKARNQAIAAIDQVKGRIVESELKQMDAGQLAAKVVADVPQDKAGPVIDQLKQLGTVSRLEVQRQEITTDGHGNAVNADTLPPGLRVEQKDARLTLSLYNLANVAPRQTANVELACDDVGASYHAILDRVAKAGGRVLSSDLSRPSPDQVSGTISFEVKSADADGVLMDVKQAGDVMQSNLTENPDTNNVTSTKRGFSVQLRSIASVNPREVSHLSIATGDVIASYNKLLAAVQSVKARIILSRLDKEDDPNLHETAGFIDFEIKRQDLDAVQHALDAAGDLIERQVMRSADDQNTLDTKMQFKVALHNAIQLPPRKSWTLAVECSDVDAAQADVLSTASSAGGRVIDSTLSKEADGRSTAHIVVDVPLAQSAVVVDRVKHEGDVRVVQSTDNSQAPQGKLARSQLDITIASPEAIVSGDRGLWGSIRAGLSTSVAGLLYSLQLIIVGLCCVGPWVAVIWAGWSVMKRRRAAAGK
jgi:hypothetical protein